MSEQVFFRQEVSVDHDTWMAVENSVEELLATRNGDGRASHVQVLAGRLERHLVKALGLATLEDADRLRIRALHYAACYPRHAEENAMGVERAMDDLREATRP